MWFFTSPNDNRILYIVQGCKEIVVGRSTDPGVCDFSISEDSSVSKRHAIISVSGNELTLQDAGSRYGTFYNESKSTLSNQDKITLKENDVIKFGKLHSKWTLHKINFVSSSSTLKGENLEMLKTNIDKVGGSWTNEWNDSCTHLTMPAITLTIKVVLALIQGAHIVTTDYWTKCVEAINTQTKLPDPNQFVPVIIESTLNNEKVSFLPDLARRNLFNGKVFIFFTRRQLDMYKTVVLKGSGTPLLVSDTKVTKTMVCSPEYIVVQYCPNTVDSQIQKKQVSDVINYLQSKGRRAVPDSEIGLAVLYASLQIHCNPKFSLSSEVMGNNIEKIVTENSTGVLAKETQDILSNVGKKDIVIDESLMSNDISEDSNEVHMLENSNKRKLCSDDMSIDQAPAKRQALDNIEMNDDGDELFNFIGENPANQSIEKKLNFSKPQKRKAHESDDEDDLFNFLSDEKKQAKTTSNILGDTDNEECNTAKKPRLEKQRPVSSFPVRGARIKELFENDEQSNNPSNNIKLEIKREMVDDETNELKKKMNELDIGTTVVIIRDDLIKKERDTVFIESVNSNGQNFKKFRKVWPINMQVSMISKNSSRSA